MIFLTAHLSLNTKFNIDCSFSVSSSSRNMNEPKHHIIVVGGGAAGLMAAAELLKQGNRVTILEANDRLGGRIHTIRNASFKRPVEAGCEFVHGDLPLTVELLKAANIEYKPVRGTMTRVGNDGEWKTQDDFTVGWKELMEQMNEVTNDVTVDEFLRRNFSDDKYKQLRTSVLRFAEGFDLADTSKASVLALREEWMEEEEEQYRVPGGNDQLIRYLEKKCREANGAIHASAMVTSINWKRNEVTILAQNGQTYHGNKVIVTVPLGVLQADTPSINFQPAINDYLNASKKIGFGSVVKVLLQFKESFWEQRKKNIGFLFANAPIPTWWTQLPSDFPLLTGWAGGPQAWMLETRDDGTIQQLALQSLSIIFQRSVDDLEDLLTAYEIVNWRNDPFTRGGYSYCTVESVKAQELFSKPLQDTIYFAGEAFYNGPSPGTVEAALASAANVVEKILGKGR
jgi:monoamine oxidase